MPPLKTIDCIYNYDHEKSQLLNDFFARQTDLDESNASVPYIAPHNVKSPLNFIIFTPVGVEGVLNSLVTENASGPNELNNQILKELAKEHSNPLLHSLATH